jgi:hypothetical protein
LDFGIDRHKYHSDRLALLAEEWLEEAVLWCCEKESGNSQSKCFVYGLNGQHGLRE